MAQIIVRGLDDQAMAWFARRAERLGCSKEQLARNIIEREARAESGWKAFAKRARTIRERLANRKGRFPDSSRDIRKDRAR